MDAEEARGAASSGPKVLYVVGKGRSGSTLVDIILGEIDGYFSTGQLDRLWTQGLINGYACGCGLPVPECEVWGSIMSTIDPTPDPRRVARLQEHILSWRRAPRVLRAAKKADAGAWPQLREYGDVLGGLYRAISTVTGARVIVDSSKAPAHPGSLGLIPGISPYVLQLVRDPRAVAYSWRRRKAIRGRRDITEMPRFGAAYSGASWLVRNVTAERVRRHIGPDRSMLVRYEELASSPVESISAIMKMLGEVGDAPFVGEGRVKLSVNHTASGNPIRMDVGEVQLKPDREWMERITGWDRAVVSILTGPVRKRYGY